MLLQNILAVLVSLVYSLSEFTRGLHRVDFGGPRTGRG